MKFGYSLQETTGIAQSGVAHDRALVRVLTAGRAARSEFGVASPMAGVLLFLIFFYIFYESQL